MSTIERFSLLWTTPSEQQNAATLYSDAVQDLRLDAIISAFVPKGSEQRFFENTLRTLVTDPATIVYRQAIMDDLLGHAGLHTALEALLPKLDQLGTAQPAILQQHALYEVVGRLAELELFVDCVQGFATALGQAAVQSRGLQQLKALVLAISEDAAFQQLVAELPQLRAAIRQVRGVTIGVNLDHRMRPMAATLLGIHEDPFEGASLLQRIFGRNNTPRGLMPLHSISQQDMQTLVELGSRRGREANPLMIPLFRDLATVLEKVSKPVERALKRYGSVSSSVLITFREELAFYCASVRLVHKLQAAGMPMVRPQIAAPEVRLFQVNANYNLDLAFRLLHDSAEADLSQRIIGNDVTMDDTGRIFILTGPNAGGKTTYLQAIGVTQLLAQAGLHVPGSNAIISPCDNVYTHYQVEERFDSETGRFGEEAQRMQRIFAQATRHSLILLNESLASTSAGESLFLAQDVVTLFRQIGLRAVFATHLHTLAEQVDAINSGTTGESALVSMVASFLAQAGLQRSYRVEKRPPIGRSYAEELAGHYGISFNQLSRLLAERGLIR